VLSNVKVVNDSDGLCVERTVTIRLYIENVMVDQITLDDAWKDKRYDLYGEKEWRCFVCDDKFADEDKMSILFLKKGTNRLICHDCAGILSILVERREITGGENKN